MSAGLKKSRVALTLLVLTLLLLGLGIVAVYNASVVEAFRDFNNKYHFAFQQLKWAGVGLLAMFFASVLPLKTLKSIAPSIFLVGIITMILVLVPGIGARVQGARRWISLGAVTIQPSELMKLSLIIYLAAWFEKKRTLKQFLFILGIVLGLTMLQPDLGTTIVLATTGFIIYYLSGAPTSNLLSISLGGTLLGILLILSSPYRKARLLTFMDPTNDTLGASYHINQILLALGSGGLSGVGLGRSRQKYQYLPEATTDSIFAVIGEELGFIGATFLLFLFVALILTGLNIARNSKDSFSQLLAGGLIAWITLQILLNVSAMVALVPLTGVPLPLISYGGSSLITVLAAIGLLLNIARVNKK